MIKKKLATYLIILLLLFHFIGAIIPVNITMGLLGLIAFYDTNILSNLKNLITSFKFWILISPFVVFVISLLYSSNTNEGFYLIEKRLSLLAFPLIFGLNPPDKNQFELIIKSFVSIVSVLLLIGFLYNINDYLLTGDSGYFYNDNLVRLFNKQAAYFGMYINIALAGLFFLWHKNVFNKNIQKTYALLALIVLLSSQYLLASRTSMIITLLLLVSFISFIGITKIGKRKASLLFISLGVLLVTLITFFPKAIKRFESIKQTEYQFDNPNQINHFNGEIKAENWNGLNTRLAIWNCAWEEIKKAPILGSGIGSQQENLIKNYKSKQFNFAIQSNYNSHNQYLDILLSNGFIGLLIFAFFIIYLAINSIHNKNYVLFITILIFVLSCLTENILNRNQGIVIIALMLNLSFIPLNIKTIKKTDNQL